MDIVLVLVVYLLAVMRLTRLANADTVLDPVRIKLARRYGAESAIITFLGCPWCIGLWLSVAGAPLAVLALGWSWWWTLPLALSCSQLVGMAAPLYSDEELAIETVAV